MVLESGDGLASVLHLAHCGLFLLMDAEKLTHPALFSTFDEFLHRRGCGERKTFWKPQRSLLKKWQNSVASNPRGTAEPRVAFPHSIETSLGLYKRDGSVLF